MGYPPPQSQTTRSNLADQPFVMGHQQQGAAYLSQFLQQTGDGLLLAQGSSRDVGSSANSSTGRSNRPG